MSTPEKPQAIIGWNLQYRAKPGAQYNHMQRLEARARANGAKTVLFCLSELTTPLSTDQPGAKKTLSEILESDGYTISSRHTTLLRNNRVSEGIGFASRDPELSPQITEALFFNTVSQKANWFKVANWLSLHRMHQRRLGSVALDDLEVFTTHASYHSPDSKERHAILQDIGEPSGKKLLIGDLNTGLNHRLVREAQAAGWEKLRDPRGRITFPLRPGRMPIKVWGLELDHALVSPELKDLSQLEIGVKGPSDHHPLTVLITPDESSVAIDY